MLAIVIAVGVKEHSEPSEEVSIAEDGPGVRALLGVPEGKAVAKQVLSLPVDVKVEQHLPVVHPDRLGGRGGGGGGR